MKQQAYTCRNVPLLQALMFIVDAANASSMPHAAAALEAVVGHQETQVRCLLLSLLYQLFQLEAGWRGRLVSKFHASAVTLLHGMRHHGKLHILILPGLPAIKPLSTNVSMALACSWC
eukprot:GHRQ01037192.1.p1 GENE.GHRQ01037192.1~~GHRQ01037192.1.p1  ORF type:complete len:118 (+),score=13.91 GHRQ01037192.1:534-887(+)